ncbi:MAG: hypothetical protein CVU95_00875 [Firmicutes bacterium HGW-Firmicutes-2]|nr:MAG: hypothetical protein CVU95_00875 [Firmicutes bacterium HGW-Firmicutes-2]
MVSQRKITSVKKMKELWDEYKDYCNNRQVLAHEFSSKNSEFVSAVLKRSVTYTIEGFCNYVNLSRQAFYADYAGHEKFLDIVTRMREECEVDNREKFELGMIPTQLAGLWMSKYGYTTRSDNNVMLESSQKFADILEQVGGEGLEE